ncbi:MAG: pyruvate kinase [Chlamydiales bacterium]
MESRTKIVCTMGPAVNHPQKIDQLIEAGMNVARINFSHGTHEEHRETINNLKQARERAKIPLAIMLDTKGPEIRLGKLKEEQITLKEGQTLWLVREEIEGNEREITLKPSIVFESLKKDMFVLLDDGYIITHVVAVENKGVKVEVDHGGVIRSTRGVNVPTAEIALPAMTEQDVEDIRFGCKEGIDLIAASFIRSADHIISIKKLLKEEKSSGIGIIAKIENHQGVQNFDDIAKVADGIMIARGDLGVELPLSRVPHLQKKMIRACYLAAKPSVTATQMLESMIIKSRPTRAEVSDVANAIYDSTSAVMLSGETAIGSYPVETVKIMKEIAEEAEKDFNNYEFFKTNFEQLLPDTPTAVTKASIKTAYGVNAKAIFAFTASGLTARLLARMRPEMPIIAMTPNPRVYHQLAIVWGVIPILRKDVNNIEDAKKKISEYALSRQIVAYGDPVVITAGTPFGKAGTTNMMIVDTITV